MRSPASVRPAIIVAALLGVAPAVAAPPQSVAPFSAAAPGGPLPGAWVPTEIRGAPRPTQFRLVADDQGTVLQAESRASASALVHKVRIEAAERPQLQWRWKVSRVVAGGNPATREGDDFAARVYVLFDYPLEKLPLGERLKLRAARVFFDPDVPAAALCYVWDSRLPAGTILPSPYTSRVRIIVVNSGSGDAGQWRSVERDLEADFRRAFGEALPAVAAVAVAADTDNTGEQVTSWFGDIVLKKRAVNGGPGK